MRTLCGGLLAVGLAVAAGCGGAGQGEVEGAVSYDGQPVDAGTIAFMGGGQGARNAGGTILDGRYVIPAETGPLPGSYKVEIRWAKKNGKKYKSVDGELLDDTSEGLPDKYHNRSELTAEIKPGKNVVNFDLKK